MFDIYKEEEKEEEEVEEKKVFVRSPFMFFLLLPIPTPLFLLIKHLGYQKCSKAINI